MMNTGASYCCLLILSLLVCNYLITVALTNNFPKRMHFMMVNIDDNHKCFVPC